MNAGSGVEFGVVAGGRDPEDLIGSDDLDSRADTRDEPFRIGRPFGSELEFRQRCGRHWNVVGGAAPMLDAEVERGPEKKHQGALHAAEGPVTPAETAQAEGE